MESMVMHRGVAVAVRLPERFVMVEAHALKEHLLSLMDAGQVHFEFSFEDCQFIDSSGLGALVTVYKRCLDRQGSVVLVKMTNQQVREVFRLTKLDRVFTIK